MNSLGGGIAVLVYENALFTICAADSHDASAGLRAAEAILHVQTPIALGRERVQLPDDVDSRPMSEGIGNGIRLIMTRPLEAAIDDSEWNKRAWTFQERILVYFPCRITCNSQGHLYQRNSKARWLDQPNSRSKRYGNCSSAQFGFI